MTAIQRTNSTLMIAVLVISLIIHVLFVVFFSLGRTVGGYDYPTNRFLRVESIFIENSVYGEDPLMQIDRTILQAFPGTWTTRIATNEGEWICGNSGTTPYSPDARLPEPTRLFDFWLFIDKNRPNEYCRGGYYPLPVGCYITDTTWEIHDDRVKPPRLVSSRSNEFCVTSEVTTEG